MVPPQLPPEVLSARMLLTSVTLAGAPYIAPPPKVALLAEKLLLVTVVVPPFKMAPPPKVPWLPEKLLLVTIRVPMAPFTIAPPLGELLPEKVLLVTIRVPRMLLMAPPTRARPLAMVRFSTVNVTPGEVSENPVPPGPVFRGPLMVITPPPSMVVSALMIFLLPRVIVAAPPQAKVTVPSKLAPPGRQAHNAAPVQLALVPVPTTHASADEVAADRAKTSRARTGTNRVRTVVVFIASLLC